MSQYCYITIIYLQALFSKHNCTNKNKLRFQIKLKRMKLLKTKWPLSVTKWLPLLARQKGANTFGVDGKKESYNSAAESFPVFFAT